jgi:catechol 2,3-dioxygenase-like lactoylglutathione lyase family enzyme
MFRRLDNVGLAVTQLGRILDFYEQTLGLRVERGESDGWVHLENASLYVFETQQGQVERLRRGVDLSSNPPGIDHIALGVDDIEQACADLAAKGIVFLGPINGEQGELRYRGFQDPEGNMLYVVERPA